MKVLVTGALGFIGSNICEQLVADGHEVHALDNMHTGSEENIGQIGGRIKVHKKDAGSVASLNEKFDAVLHQGIYSSSPMYKENPHLTARAIDEWLSMLEYARKTECRLVFASSSSIYNGNHPPHGERMPVLVRDYYAEARYAMERLAELYNSLYGMRVAGLRYFSVYGPHEKAKGRYANLITQFLWEMQAGRRPVILGDGKQTRDFVYVGDVVEANMLAMKSTAAGIFNVGTGRSVSLNEMTAMLKSKLGSDLAPEYRPNPIKNYVMHTQADTQKAEKELGFRAKTPLEAGMDLLIKAYPK